MTTATICSEPSCNNKTRDPSGFCHHHTDGGVGNASAAAYLRDLDAPTTSLDDLSGSGIKQTTTAKTIIASMKSGKPILIEGRPGEGKSAWFRGLAAEMDIPIYEVIGSQCAPEDFNGVPRVTDEGLVREPPDWFVQLEKTGKGIIFLDELTSVPYSTQAAMLRFIESKAIDQRKLPKDVYIVAACNPADQAAAGQGLAPPTINRFRKLTWQLDDEDWKSGMTTGFVGGEPLDENVALARAKVASFIHSQPQHIREEPQDDEPWASPRQWTNVADTLAHVDPDDIAVIHQVLEGSVGQKAAIAYQAWDKFQDLPSPQELMKDPSLIDWSDRSRIDRSFMALNSTIAYTSNHLDEDDESSYQSWTDAVKLTTYAAENGPKDVATNAFLTLMKMKPKGLKASEEIKAFIAVAGDALTKNQ